RSLAAAPPIAQLVLVGFPMSYWAVARLEPRREQLALRCSRPSGVRDLFSAAARASDLTRTQDRDPAAALSRLLFPHGRGAMVRRPLEHRCHRYDHGWHQVGARC